MTERDDVAQPSPAGAGLIQHWRDWTLPLTLFAAALVIELFGDAGRTWLRFDRVGLEQGQWWRLLTGHFAHLGWNHFWLNMAGLALVWALFHRYLTRTAWIVTIGLSVVAISAGLYFLNSSLQWYVGLSGALHGMFLAGIAGALRNGMRLEWLLLAAVAGKLAWEQWQGALPGTAEMAGGPVVVDAHLYGAVAGVLIPLLCKRCIRAG